MIRKTQVEVFKDGKWEPIQYRLDYTRIAAALILLSVAIFFLWTGVKRLMPGSAQESAPVVSGEPDSDNEIVAVADLYGETFIFDKKGTTYQESNGKLISSKRIPFKLGINETLAGAAACPDGILFAVNNNEDRLTKFVLWDGDKAKEDKVFFSTETLSNKDKTGRMFLSREGRFLYRAETGQWKQIKVPTDVNLISDYILQENTLYVLGTNENLWATPLDNVQVSDNRWQRLINSDEKDNQSIGNADDKTSPLILQAIGKRLLILNSQGGIEEWNIAEKTAILKEYWSFSEILKNKPAVLASFILKEIKTLNGRTWCYLSANSPKCIDRNHTYQIYKLPANTLLIANRNEFLIETSTPN